MVWDFDDVLLVVVGFDVFCLFFIISKFIICGIKKRKKMIGIKVVVVIVSRCLRNW